MVKLRDVSILQEDFEQRKKNDGQYASVTPDFHRELSCDLLKLRLILSCGWIRVAAVLSPGGWMQVTPESSSGSSIQVTADSILRLTRVPAAGYGLWSTRSYGWLLLRQLGTSYSWLHPTADSKSGGWIRLKADSILRLILFCGWLESFGWPILWYIK